MSGPELQHEPAGAGLGEVLRRHWRLVVLTALAAAALAAALAVLRGDRYEATAELLFAPPGPELVVLGTPVTGSGDPDRDAATNAARVDERRVAEAAARRLGMDLETLREDVEVVGEEGASVVVTAQADTEARAVEVANVFANTARGELRRVEAFRARQVRELFEQRYAELPARAQREPRGQSLLERIQTLEALEQVGTNSPRLTQRAQEADRLTDPVRIVALGGLLGLGLGGGLALLRTRSERRVHDDADLADDARIPVLATVPRGRGLRAGALLPALAMEEAEPFRLLFARLRFSPHPPRVVLVTSARDGEGKTTVAANLAAAAAGAGSRVLLVSADLRDPALDRRLGLDGGAGLAQLLEGDAPAADAIRRVELDGDGGPALEVIASGGPSSGAILAHAPRLAGLLPELRERYDLVVIDTPPVGVVADAIPLLPHVDGVVLCTLVGRSTREETLRVGESVAQLGGEVLGLVVSNDEPVASAYGRPVSRPTA